MTLEEERKDWRGQDSQFQAVQMGMEGNNYGEKKKSKDSQIYQHLWISYCVQ